MADEHRDEQDVPPSYCRVIQRDGRLVVCIRGEPRLVLPLTLGLPPRR